MVASNHIAIVEDDTALRLALGDLMRATGYRASLFASAGDFLNQMDRHDFTGVIADVQMPGASGFDLARALATTPRPLPIILITAGSDARLDEEARRAGSIALLRKPFDPDILLDHIERSFGGASFPLYPPPAC